MFNNTLNSGLCPLLPGHAVGLPWILSTMARVAMLWAAFMAWASRALLVTAPLLTALSRVLTISVVWVRSSVWPCFLPFFRTQRVRSSI